MNQDNLLEQQLATLGASLQARPSVTDRVLVELRAVRGADSRPPIATVHGRRRTPAFWAVTAGCALAMAGVLAAILAAPSSQIAWAQVANAVQSQDWIRGTRTADGTSSVVWVSPKRQLWAYQLGRSCYFFDARQRVQYEYHPGNDSVSRLPLGEKHIEQVLPLGGLVEGEQTLAPWLFGTEKIMSQERREIRENGQTWIEFRLLLWRGEMNQATLRVDPDTRLPVHLVLKSPKDATARAEWQFDYPAEGPEDVYALGVPGDVKIVDEVLLAEDAQKTLDTIVASRSKLGDFRVLVVPKPGIKGSVVWRKGDRWRVDQCLLYQHPGTWPTSDPPDNAEVSQWFDQQLQAIDRDPLYVCDGATVWENTSFQPGSPPEWRASKQVAPQDLMSGEGWGMLSMAPHVKFTSLLYPDLSPRHGWEFSFESTVPDEPGVVLIKRSAKLATAEPMVGHEWYFVDPARGCVVVRAELFNLPADAPADPGVTRVRQTIEMEGFRQTPGGGWYCTTINDAMPVAAGALPPTSTPISKHETSVRYYFDFHGELPDSLFAKPEP